MHIFCMTRNLWFIEVYLTVLIGQNSYYNKEKISKISPKYSRASRYNLFMGEVSYHYELR